MQKAEIEKQGGQGEICLCRYVSGENVEFMRGRQASERRTEGERPCVAMANRDVWIARERV